MARGDTLTAKQASFCGFVAAGETQTDAYIKAYDTKKISRNGASVEATRLMKIEKVKNRIDDLKADSVVAQRAQDKISKHWILEKLRTEAGDEENPSSVRVRALEILAKTEKLFDDSTNVTIQHRSSEEVEQELLARLKDLNLTLN